MKKQMLGQKGLTIVELLVAMAVSLVLMAGIYRVFIGSTDTYSVTDRLSRMQESGRYAVDALKRGVRSAGYLGCAQDTSQFYSALNGGTSLQSFLNDFSNAVSAFEATGVNTWQDSAGTTFTKAQVEAATGITDPLSGSDVLVLRGVDASSGIGLVTGMPGTSAVLMANTGMGATLSSGGGEILLVSDCESTSVFQSTGYNPTSGMLQHNSGSGSPGNTSNELGHAFDSGAEVLFPQTTVFFVSNNADGVPALYQDINDGGKQELVEGVESMHLRFGEDTTSPADRAVDVYRKANAVADWDNVLSVRMGLLLRSDVVARADFAAGSFDVDGDGTNDYTVATADRRMRLVMSGTMGLRNRLR
jgi:type IV pilus assembly protein PilW